MDDHLPQDMAGLPGAADRVSDPEVALVRLRAVIAEAGLRPGDRIPAERELTDRLGLTRGALRRALEALERDGLIWRHVGKGTFLSGGAGGPEPSDPVSLARRTTPVKMMQARLAVEPAIVAEAAIHASGEALDAIAAAAAACRAAADWESYEAADDAFHRTLAQAADNLPLLALFDQLNAIRRTVAWGHVERRQPRPASDHTSFAEHDAIVAAIRARDPRQAGAAMRAHLRSVSARLFEE